ncbi:hypothetical protein CLV53_101450 [Sediminibacterium magnilacihabitans]|jgi:hypothetical protein|nr:hypothetical protein CLV53_101450 [Sediminibacterium magnilacihabitans]
MELFPPLTHFYNAIANDARIGTAHISLYIALFQQWNLNKGENPILIERNHMMKAAKINSRHTYNQCMNNLHEFGYIIYEPAANNVVLSKVKLNYCENEK